MTLSNAENRSENIRDAFGWQLQEQTDKSALRGKYVWLIDDVITTGSTLGECARILKKEAGTCEVFGIVIAR